MGLDFSHTCPKIDKAISSAKDTIQAYLKDYIIELSPYVSEDKADELSTDWAEQIYNEISDCFELVRETNEDMRKQADSQIDNLEGEVSELKSEIDDLSRQLDELS